NSQTHLHTHTHTHTQTETHTHSRTHTHTLTNSNQGSKELASTHMHSFIKVTNIKKVRERKSLERKREREERVRNIQGTLKDKDRKRDSEGFQENKGGLV